MKCIPLLLILILAYHTKAQDKEVRFEHPQIALFAGAQDDLGKIAFFYFKNGHGGIKGSYLRIGKQMNKLSEGVLTHSTPSLTEGQTRILTEDLLIQGQLSEGNIFDLTLQKQKSEDKNIYAVRLMKIEPNDKRAGIYGPEKEEGFSENTGISLYPDGKGGYLIAMFWNGIAKETEQNVVGSLTKVEDGHFLFKNTDNSTVSEDCNFHFQFINDTSLEFWSESQSSSCLAGIVKGKKYKFSKR
ncbi:MAG: hypothetical protein MK212_11575 [Saprospiraceae bacterium]|nr:hypothetical protein [Saprospiraceae bacterium]